MKFLFTLGSRGEWGYIQPVIDEAQRRGHICHIWACNMSVLPEYGLLVDNIDNNSYHVVHRALTAISGDSTEALTRSFGLTAMSFADFLTGKQYDWIICAGDRLEQLAVVTVAFGQGMPVSHIQAGERSGNIDGMTRHAIARFTHLHFASNDDAAERLIKSGESPSRVFVTGAPQLDGILDSLPTREELVARNVCPQGEFLLSVIHGVTDEKGKITDKISILQDVLEAYGLPVVWIGSNNDTSGDAIKKLVLNRLQINDKYYVNLNRLDYLALLRDCKFLIGNSSSGLLEAPSFGTPVINLGSRQRDRVRAGNVVDALFEEEEIKGAIVRISSANFLQQCKSARNPYGDGKSSAIIVSLLENQDTSAAFLTKQIEY